MSRINRSLLRKAKRQLAEQAKSEDTEAAETAQEILSRDQTRRVTKREVKREVRPQRSKTKVTYNFSPGQLVKIGRRDAYRYGAAPEEAYIVIGVSNSESHRSIEENYWIDITGPAGLITVRAGALRNF